MYSGRWMEYFVFTMCSKSGVQIKWLVWIRRLVLREWVVTYLIWILLVAWRYTELFLSAHTSPEQLSVLYISFSIQHSMFRRINSTGTLGVNTAVDASNQWLLCTNTALSRNTWYSAPRMGLRIREGSGLPCVDPTVIKHQDCTVCSKQN